MKYAYTAIKKKENGMYVCIVNESAEPIVKKGAFHTHSLSDSPFYKWSQKHIEVKFYSAEQEILIETHIRSVSVDEHIDKAFLMGVETDCVVVIDGRAHFKMPVYENDLADGTEFDSTDFNPEQVLNNVIYNMLFTCFLHGRNTKDSFKDFNDRNNLVGDVKKIITTYNNQYEK